MFEVFLQEKMGFKMIDQFLKPGSPKIDEGLFDNEFVTQMVDYVKDGNDYYNVDDIKPPEPEPVDNELEKRYNKIKLELSF